MVSDATMSSTRLVVLLLLPVTILSCDDKEIEQ